MNNILYVIAGIFTILWIIGYIGFHSTWGHVFAIHGFILFAIIAVVLRRIKWEKLD